MKKVRMLWRLCFYFAGLLVLAFGVVVARNADLGISPVSSVPYAIFLSLNAHGITALTLGTCVNLVYCFYVLVQIILLRRQFKPVNLLQLLVSTVFGWFVDFAVLVLGSWAIPTYFGKLAMLAISILLIAVGISLYLGAKLLPMASEGMGLAITDKLKKYPYHRVKMVIDCVFVALAILIMLIFTGSIVLDGAWVVREGTVATALVVGIVMGWLRPVLGPLLQKLCFGPPEEAEKA